MLFSNSGKIPKARFDMTGRLLKRRMPVEISPPETPPPPTPGSPEDIVDLMYMRKGTKRKEYHDISGVATELIEELPSPDGIRVIPDKRLFIDDYEERLYAKNSLGVLGGGGYI